jgi:hypothetical protein
MAASRRRRSGLAHLSVGENGWKWVWFDRCILLYGRTEREEAIVVLHVGIRTPAAYQTGWTTTQRQDAYLGSLTGVPWSVFETWCEPESVWAALFISLAR